MKIETTIPLRKDGTVRMTCPSGAKHVFKDNGEGVGLLELDAEADIAYILSFPEFYPSEDEDIEQASALMAKVAEAAKPAPADEGSLASMSDAALRDHVEMLTGKKPGPRTKRENLIAAVREAEAANELPDDEE